MVMSEKYVFRTLHSEETWRHVRAWENFMNECEWKSNTATTWLANEWNANFVGEAIIFENEQDKLMWILRWS